MNFLGAFHRAVTIAAFFSSIALAPCATAQVASYTDATADISPGISNGGGTLDIVSMEVAETATDLVFTLTVNGNISTTDWGNFMIGIANTKSAGATTGNGWNRPINMNTPAGTGMTHWIGSWVNAGGGAQLWTYNGAGWDEQTTSAPSLVATPGTQQSTIEYTVSKAGMAYEDGDVLFFDAYSSGSGGTDSAVDALSNPNISITSWGQTYTSALATGISRYPEAAGVSANITFRVDMNAQILAGNFDPIFDLVEVLPVGNSAFAKADMNEVPGEPGIYEIAVFATAPEDSAVGYRFSIVGSSADLPEDLTRTFAMPATATTLGTVFFDDIQGYREITFRVDMNAQITSGAFDPATQSVLVVGNFNGFSEDPLTNPPLTDPEEDGIYETTLLLGGVTGATAEFKFFTTAGAGTDSGYEFPGANRAATLELNPDGAFTPAQVLPVAIYGIPDNARPVTFTVDMSLEAAAGRFDPLTDNARVTGAFNDWNTGADYNLNQEGDTLTYSGTFLVGGIEGADVPYKFFNSNPLAPASGYEPGDNRVLTLGPVINPQVLPPAIFGTTSSQVRDITFSVDMSVQVALGLFNPDETDPAVGGIVQVRGLSDNFDSGPQLAREGDSFIYSATVPVPGDEGSTLGYKFWSPGINFYDVQGNTGFEQIILGDTFSNRTVTLEANGAPMTLPTVYFSNQLFFVGSTPLNPFSTTQGTASGAQTVTVNGQGLTADIVATAPAGFELSEDGVTYGSTATIAPVSGSVTAATLSVRIAASAAAGSPAGNVALTSDGSQPVNIAVTGTVTASSGYGSWASGFGLDPAVTTGPTAGAPGADPDGDIFTNEQEFAFGTNPTVGSPALLQTQASGENLTVTWLQRGDVTYAVQGTDNLAATPFAGLTVTITDGPSIPEPPAGYSRKQFTIPATGRNFYRVQATITGN